LLLGGCISAPPEPGQRIAAPGDCLRKVEIAQLDTAVQRCNAVVAALPNEPQPRNDRALLHSLAGNNTAACRDSFAAAALLKRQGSKRPDAVLVEEIQLRQRSCQRLAQRRPITTPPATAAPSPAAPAAATP
jgi:endonuclease/exonuclease/phosphatase (EEP) superfamily protein YafD